ncbi:MAG TPA: nuclear transport factor 2 family protein [Chloroflexota bacterium]|nr:nuclear transport factor 2 family protein [Chloroflexota bacterium]
MNRHLAFAATVGALALSSCVQQERGPGTANGSAANQLQHAEQAQAANAGRQQTSVDVWMTPANPVAAAALQHPRVAAALEARMRVQRALVAGDADVFGGGFAPDGVVNSPFNNVATAAEAARRSRAGALNYKYIHTSIEYAAPRREDEVVFMGEETYEFAAGMPEAGKPLRRRFTDLYQNVEGRWLLSLRQAPIISDN